MIKMQKQKRVFNTRGGWTLEWESPVAKNIKDILEFYGEHGEKELVRYWNDKMQRRYERRSSSFAVPAMSLMWMHIDRAI